MKSAIQIFFLCPIPEEQKPIQQYVQWKQARVEERKQKNLPQLALQNIFLWIRFPFSYFFWQQFQTRFLCSRFLYEEASWFDTQIWEKPLPIIKNDRFLQSQSPYFSFLFIF
jgi:hypothetical protein